MKLDLKYLFVCSFCIKVLRKDLKKHGDDFMQSHMILMCGRFAEAEQKLEKQEKTIKRLKLKNRQSKAKIMSMEGRLSIPASYSSPSPQRTSSSANSIESKVNLGRSNCFADGVSKFLLKKEKGFPLSYIQWVN